ncbi:hypothetical protein [Kaistella sp.]|uniref:hypothetical protein n=1 Tax=Kaistella sp. TaxID=2782235 RepID=UPI003C5B2DEE
MKNLLIKLLLMNFMFVFSVFYAQENFKDPNLARIQEIAYGIKYKNTVGFMKKMDYQLTSEKEYDFGHFYHFENDSGSKIVVYYNKESELETVSIQLPTSTRDLAQLDLEDKDFVWVKEDNGFVIGVRWRKMKYPFNYYFENTDEEYSSIKLYVN